MLNAGDGKRFQHTINICFHQASREAWYSVPIPVFMPNNVEREEQTVSTSFNIRNNKRNVEQMLKQSLNAFNIDSTSFKGVANGFDIALQQNRMDVDTVCSGLYFSVVLRIELTHLK